MFPKWRWLLRYWLAGFARGGGALFFTGVTALLTPKFPVATRTQYYATVLTGNVDRGACDELDRPADHCMRACEHHLPPSWSPVGKAALLHGEQANELWVDPLAKGRGVTVPTDTQPKAGNVIITSDQEISQIITNIAALEDVL